VIPEYKGSYLRETAVIGGHRWIGDQQIKGIDSENCRLVAVYGESGGYRLLGLAETISERALCGYVG
jgi:hypothetical protein